MTNQNTIIEKDVLAPSEVLFMLTPIFYQQKIIIVIIGCSQFKIG